MTSRVGGMNAGDEPINKEPATSTSTSTSHNHSEEQNKESNLNQTSHHQEHNDPSYNSVENQISRDESEQLIVDPHSHSNSHPRLPPHPTSHPHHHPHSHPQFDPSIHSHHSHHHLQHPQHHPNSNGHDQHHDHHVQETEHHLQHQHQHQHQHPSEPRRRTAFPLDSQGIEYYSTNQDAPPYDPILHQQHHHHQDPNLPHHHHHPAHPSHPLASHPNQEWGAYHPSSAYEQFAPESSSASAAAAAGAASSLENQQEVTTVLAPPPLLRNQACLSCRRRKMKCDAARPVCGTCARSKAAAATAKHGAPVPPGPCIYETVKPKVKATPAPKKRRKGNHSEEGGFDSGYPQIDPNYVQGLEQRLRAMQEYIEQQQQQQHHQQQHQAPHRLEEINNQQSLRGRSLTEPNQVTESNQTINNQSGGSNSGNSDYGMDNWARGSNGSGSGSGNGNGNGNGLRPVPATTIANDGDRDHGSVPVFGMLQHDGNSTKRVRMQFHTRAMPPPNSINSNRRGSTNSNYSHLGPSPSDSTGVGGGNIPSTSRSGLNDSNHNGPRSGPEADPLLEILFPGYPSDFPAPDTVYHLSEIFFSRCPLSSAIHKSTFMAGLSLPMKHRQRPNDALIHSIMAVAAPLSPYFEGSRPSVRKQRMNEHHQTGYSINGSGIRKELYDPRASSFAEFHLIRAQVKNSKALTLPHSPLDRCISGLICCYILWGSTRFVEAFSENAQVQRTVLISGLTRLGLIRSKFRVPSIIPIPSCDSEEHERRLLFWWCYITDVYNGGAGFLWEPLLDDNAIITSLPGNVGLIQAGREPKPNPQTLKSEDLFQNGHVDDFSLHLKSCILLKKAYLLHSRTPIEENHLRKPQEFKSIENSISEFVQSFPPEDTFSPVVSVDRLLGWCNTQMALVLLHEPFITSPELECESYGKVSVAVNATLAAVQKLCATSFDFGLLHPQLFLCWLVVGRMICKEIERQRRAGNPGEEAAPETIDALEMIISAFYRAAEFHPCGARCFQLLQRFRSGKISEEMLGVCMYVEGLIPVDEDDILFPEDNLPSVPEALVQLQAQPQPQPQPHSGPTPTNGGPAEGFQGHPTDPYAAERQGIQDPRSSHWQAGYSNSQPYYHQEQDPQMNYQSHHHGSHQNYNPNSNYSHPHPQQQQHPHSHPQVSHPPHPQVSHPPQPHQHTTHPSTSNPVSNGNAPPPPLPPLPSSSTTTTSSSSHSKPYQSSPTRTSTNRSVEERYVNGRHHLQHSNPNSIPPPPPNSNSNSNPNPNQLPQVPPPGSRDHQTYDDGELPVWTLHYGDSIG